MSKKDKRKKERGPLTPRKKKESMVTSSDGLGGSARFFGFNTPSKDGVAGLFDAEPALCMATEVSQADVASLAAGGVTALPGEWVVSSGGHDSPRGIVVHGPFKTMDEAFAAASTAYGVTRWTSPVQSF